jgi:hypothetical protein
MDLPGRRSHEYFPELSRDGKWMVWGITQRGHDHDIADYEIYLWEVGSPPDKAARLTFNSGNDRWPDIFIPSAAPAKEAEKPSDEASDDSEKEEEPPKKSASNKKGKTTKKGKK